MKIEIVRDCTNGIEDFVWRASRHQDTDCSGVNKIDAPVMDFPILTLAIECTIAEREVFVSYRDHVMWARTSRVDDPLLFEVDSMYDPRYYEVNRATMTSNKNHGMSQDDYRMQLPLVAMTSFTLQVSIRTLKKMQMTFDALSKYAASGLFYRAAEVIQSILQSVGYGHVEMGYVDVLPKPESGSSGRVGDMVTIYLPSAPIALRAQAIRHRSLMIKDNMIDKLKHVDVLTIGSQVELQISADISTWRHIAEKRQCWLAQHDLWRPVLKAVSSIVDLSQALPCSGGACPYEADAVLRYSDKDPNPPCPMHAHINKIRFIEHTVDALQMVKRDSRPSWWNTVIKNAGENV